jgi:signal transduction histidine kinase
LLRLYGEYYPNPAPEIKVEAAEIELDFIAEDLPKLLDSMKTGTNRIREIVLSLRNFSHLDEAQKKRVNIHTGIDSTLLILQSQLTAKAQRPAIEIIKQYGNLPPVLCYPGQLNQALLNIFNNSIDALENWDWLQGKSRSSIPTIQIRTEVLESGEIVIRITDNGSGMTENVKKRVFDPFFTTKPVGKGTGLGLSICYHIIVDKHGGMLKCKSEPGQGTEFWIQIPIQKK